MRRGLWLGVVLAVAGCAPTATERVPPLDDVDALVRDAEARQRAGAYPTAQHEFEEIVRRFPASPAHDRALFGLARTLLLADNPGRDYRQALVHFERLLREHPASAYAPDARAWRGLLQAYFARIQDLERLKQIDLGTERPRGP